ncbi:hypothetical protein MPSEU_000742200 [Mayamaea pseudoterrestris]|nr:hypothetical protein MPSEU_000742200 [Mayamaea pseudoterrestris]
MTGGEGEETSSPPKRKEDFDDDTDEKKRLKIDAEEHIALSPEPIQAHRPPKDDAGVVSSPSPQHPSVGSIHPPFPGYPMYGYYYPPPPFGHPPFLQTTPNKSEGTSRSPPFASKSDHHGEPKASNEELDELKDASAAAESNAMSTPNTDNRPQPFPFPFPPGFSPSNMPPFMMPYGRSPPPHVPIPPPPYPPGGANNPHNMFVAMMMMHSHGRTPAAQGTPLFMQCDVEQLSDYQSLLRKQLELFQAGPEDIECNTQGRKKPVVLGQVGLRCRHCSGYPLRSRGRGAVYYPSKLLGVYQAAQNMASR